jgi:hypothetical protein
MRVYYTYFDRNYAVRAVAMYRSLRRNSGPMHMCMLCLDDEAYQALQNLHLPDVTLLSLAQLERADPELLAVRATRSLVEYYWTCTSCAGWYAMENWPEAEIVTYLDSDLFFYSPPEPLFLELEGYSVGAAYQRFAEYGQPHTGRFNVGWLTWRRDPNGLACLQEYRRQCLNWCFMREEGGKYADQGYLDAWEGLRYFHVFEHRGANVAPWNLGCYKLVYANGSIQVDGYPLIFFHFHKFRHPGQNWFDTNFWNTRRVTRGLREHLILPYIGELRNSGLNLPITGSNLRHFPYRHGFGLLSRNLARLFLTVARGTLVYCRPKRP